MKPKEKRVRRNPAKERCEVLELHLKHAAGERDKAQAEADRLNAAALLASSLLKAERAELAARIAKADVLLQAIGARQMSDTSPQFSYVERGY